MDGRMVCDSILAAGAAERIQLRDYIFTELST